MVYGFRHPADSLCRSQLSKPHLPSAYEGGGKQINTSHAAPAQTVTEFSRAVLDGLSSCRSFSNTLQATAQLHFTMLRRGSFVRAEAASSHPAVGYRGSEERPLFAASESAVDYNCGFGYQALPIYPNIIQFTQPVL
jgi:hypothetical protein